MINKAFATTADTKRRGTGSSLYRFRRENRLLNARQFSRVFKQATRSRDKWFIVLCRQNEDSLARLGLAISKKHCRAATARNRIKRIVRESFRQHQSRLAGLDLVVLNSPKTASATNRQLTESLAEHWCRCERALPPGGDSGGAQDG